MNQQKNAMDVNIKDISSSYGSILTQRSEPIPKHSETKAKHSGSYEPIDKHSGLSAH